MFLNIPLGTRIVQPYEFLAVFTDILKNANKFIYEAILERDNRTPTRFYHYSVTGRIGENGTPKRQFESNSIPINSIGRNYKTFIGAKWGEKYVHKPGKYHLLEIERPVVAIDSYLSSLDPQIEDFIADLIDKDKLGKVDVKISIKDARFPLGKLHDKRIEDGRLILSKIERALKDGSDVIALSNKFFMTIPCPVHRRIKLKVIDAQTLPQYQSLIDELLTVDIDDIYEVSQNHNIPCIIYDQNIHEISPLSSDSYEWSQLERSVQTTMGPTHNFAVSVENIYKIERSDRYVAKFNAIPDHRLLFHGTTRSNLIQILSGGMKVPIFAFNGSSLGKSIYFAECITKAFQYSLLPPAPRPLTPPVTVIKEEDTGYVLVCEVALGKIHMVCASTQTPLDLEYQSRMARGSWENYPSSYVSEGFNKLLLNKKGVVSPLLPYGLMRTNLKYEVDTTYIYNEYAIFDADQCRIRYVLKLKRRYLK